MIKKKNAVLLVIMSLLLMVFLSGCIDANFHVTVNKDGSGDLDYKLMVDSSFLSLASQNGSADLQSMIDNAQKSGFTVKKLIDGSKQGFDAQKHVANLNTVIKSGDPFGIGPNSGSLKGMVPGKGLTINKSFFKTTYNLNNDLDMSAMNNSMPTDPQSRAIAQAVENQMKFTFALTLPVAPTSSNASSTQDNGRTLVWDLAPGQHNQVTMQAQVINYANVGLLIAGIVILLALILVIIIRVKHNSNKDNLPDNPPDNLTL